MPANRHLVALAVAAVLAGCSDTEELELENKKLKAAIETRAEDLRYYERQAGVAAGCDWVIKMCPASVTATGRDAQARGYGGGSSPTFWVLVAAKLSALGCLIGSLLGALSIILTRWQAPAEEKVREAQSLIEKAQQEATEARKEAYQAGKERDTALDQASKARQTLTEAQEATQKATRELKSIQEEARHAKAAFEASEARRAVTRAAFAREKDPL